MQRARLCEKWSAYHSLNLSFDRLRKVQFLHLDPPLKAIVSCIFSYVTLTLLAVVTWKRQCGTRSACPGKGLPQERVLRPERAARLRPHQARPAQRGTPFSPAASLPVLRAHPRLWLSLYGEHTLLFGLYFLAVESTLF